MQVKKEKKEGREGRKKEKENDVPSEGKCDTRC